ncbi:MAG: hypothetical protein KatS3mg110_0482 [Pirellulaceae bacterium]|nr:MAG: hypothetical protein KatS3mg110_0482 [Pirellulaceae bacterium]
MAKIATRRGIYRGRRVYWDMVYFGTGVGLEPVFQRRHTSFNSHTRHDDHLTHGTSVSPSVIILCSPMTASSF